MAEWQPIETAPHDGRQLILAAADGEVGAGYWETNGGLHRRERWLWERKRYDPYFGAEVKATRWQALPAPPGSEGA